MNIIADNRLGLFALVALTALTLFLYGQLPAEIPINFSISGESTEYLTKSIAAILIPGAYALTLILANIIIAMSPEKFAMLQSKRALDSMVFAISVLMCFLQYAILLHAGEFEFFVRYFSLGTAIFLIIGGNVIGKIERNFVIGLRFPWTMDSDAAWRHSHRAAGKSMVAAGVLLILSNFFIVNLWITVSLLAGSIAIPIFWFGIERKRNPEKWKEN